MGQIDLLQELVFVKLIRVMEGYNMFVCRIWAFDVMIKYFMQYISIETKERQVDHYEMCEYKKNVWIHEYK